MKLGTHVLGGIRSYIVYFLLKASKGVGLSQYYICMVLPLYSQIVVDHCARHASDEKIGLFTSEH